MINVCCWDAQESANCLCPVFIYFICLAMEVAGNQINTFEEVLFLSLELKNGWKITCKSSATTWCELWQIPLSQHTPRACECLFFPLSVPQEAHSCHNAVLNPCAGLLSLHSAMISLLCVIFPLFCWAFASWFVEHWGLSTSLGEIWSCWNLWTCLGFPGFGLNSSTSCTHKSQSTECCSVLTDFLCVWGWFVVILRACKNKKNQNLRLLHHR